MKTYFNMLVSLAVACIIMFCFMLTSKLFKFDYKEIAFFSGWVSCMGYVFTSSYLNRK